MAEKTTIADFTSAVEPFGGEVVETNIDEKDLKALKKVLKNA